MFFLHFLHDIPFFFMQYLIDPKDHMKETTIRVIFWKCLTLKKVLKAFQFTKSRIFTPNVSLLFSSLLPVQHSNSYLNIESSHRILELETTPQNGSWCLSTRLSQMTQTRLSQITQTKSDTWISVISQPLFSWPSSRVSKMDISIIAKPPDSWQALHLIRTLKKKNSPCYRHLLVDPRAKLRWDQCWISMVEPKTLAIVKTTLTCHLISIHVCGEVASVHQTLFCQREVASVSWHQPRCNSHREKEEKDGAHLSVSN